MPQSCVKGTGLRTERLSDGRRTLLCDLVVEVKLARDAQPEQITVKSGFETDFSSIPTALQWIVRWSRVDIAGVVHDWLYATGVMKRRRADEIWRTLALSGSHHANLFQAYICWIGLLACGWYSWKRHSRDRQKVQRHDTEENQASSTEK